MPTETIVYSVRPFGPCICGHAAYTTVNGQPAHPCCAREGANCQPCAISRDANRRTIRRSSHKKKGVA